LALFWTVNRTGRLAFDRAASNLENWFFDLSNRNADHSGADQYRGILGGRNGFEPLVQVFMMNIEVKALITSLLISGMVVGAFLGTARIVQSNAAVPSGKSARQNSPIENPKVAAGAKLFALNCAHCHGIDASGDEGPDLHKVAKTDERIKSTILNGVKGEMPAFGKKLTDDDARTLVTFIRSMSAK